MPAGPTHPRLANLRAAGRAEGLSCFRDSSGLHRALAGDRKRGKQSRDAAPANRSYVAKALVSSVASR